MNEKRKRVKMLRSTAGSPNGVNIINYKAGDIVELSPKLYKSFVIDMEVAEDYNGDIEPIAPVETKKVEPVVENKAEDLKTENKTTDSEKVEIDKEVTEDKPKKKKKKGFRIF